MKLTCFHCGKSVSTEVPDSTVFRAVAECPECLKLIEDASIRREDVQPLVDVIKQAAQFPGDEATAALLVGLQHAHKLGLLK